LAYWRQEDEIVPKGVRVSIIKRIYQNDDQSSGVWVDVERVVEITVTGQQVDGLGLQEVYYNFDWDSFDSMVKATNPENENVEYKELSEGDSSSDDTTSSSGDTIKIPLRRKIDTDVSHIYFSNGKDNETRKVHTKRVYHYDIPDDQLDANGQPPSDPETYKSLLTDDVKDETQFLDIEIIDGHVLEQNRGQKYSKQKWAQNINAILSEGL
jgi:hypothetical protein